MSPTVSKTYRQRVLVARARFALLVALIAGTALGGGVVLGHDSRPKQSSGRLRLTADPPRDKPLPAMRGVGVPSALPDKHKPQTTAAVPSTPGAGSSPQGGATSTGGTTTGSGTSPDSSGDDPLLQNTPP